MSSNAKLAAAKWIKGIDSDNDDVDQQGGHAAPDFIVANVIIVAPPVRVTKLARIKCDRLSFLIEPRNRQKIAQTSQQILDSNLSKKKKKGEKKFVETPSTYFYTTILKGKIWIKSIVWS